MEQMHTYGPWRFKTRLPNCQIWEHLDSGTIAQAYPVLQLERTHARINRNKPHLVNTLGRVVDPRTQQTLLLVERIPNRLSQVGTLNETQTLKVLHAAFLGLQQLQETYGYTGLTQACICFNEQGKVKVWINPDLSCLHPIALARDQGLSTITQIMEKVVAMVQKRCFNNTFLKNFTRKLGDHRVFSFRQAAEEILRIAELLFIDVQDKHPNRNNTNTNNTNGSNKNSIHSSLNNHHSPTPQNPNNNNNNINVNTKVLHETYEQPKVNTNKGKHFRNFSGHNNNQKQDHKRFQSFLQKQPKKQHQVVISSNKTSEHCQLNLNKFALSQTSDNRSQGLHKSAPMSPRETSQSPVHKAPTKMQKKPEAQKKSLNLKMPKKPIQVIKRVSKPLLQPPELKQHQLCDDSFSNNLKVDGGEILVSGEFQTFGLLQDLNQNINSNNVNNNIEENKNLFDKQSDFSIALMDYQIQKNLQKKNKQKEKRKISIVQHQQSKSQKPIFFTQPLNSATAPTQKPIKSQPTRTLYQPYPSSSECRQKQNTPIPVSVSVSPSPSPSIYYSSYSYQKYPLYSPTSQYIDKKYQQYIHYNNNYIERQRTQRQQVSKHFRQNSQLDNNMLLINPSRSALQSGNSSLTARSLRGHR